MMYHNPLQMSFKLLAFGPQISVKDASGQQMFYVHQKALKLKEDVGVFSDSSRGQQLFRIQADRIIDFSAAYTITDMNGMVLGKIRREGMRSMQHALTGNVSENHARPRARSAIGNRAAVREGSDCRMTNTRRKLINLSRRSVPRLA